MAQEIDHEPALKLSVDMVLKNMICIKSLANNLKTRHLNMTHKFGIEVPKSIAEAYALDKKNGDTLW